MVEQRSIDSKVLAWYEFTEGCRILYIGKKDDKLYRFLKDRKLQVDIDINTKKSLYDYIVMFDNSINIDILKDRVQYLKDDGVILLGFNNMFGISKFLSYDCENRISALEKDENNNLTSIDKIKSFFTEKGYTNSNIYMPFPNINRVDVILSDKIENISDKIDKYFVEYSDGMTILAKEINLLRKISEYNNELFYNLSNAYIMEVSKAQLTTKIKYVSYNNYRKEEYQLITIIKDDIVEKKPATTKATDTIEKIGKNLQYINGYDIELLDRYENKKLYSVFMDKKETFDIELSKLVSNEDKLINELKAYYEMLKENSVKYSKEYKKEFCDILKKQDENVLSKFNYLEYAFYDMVPKNCFYVDNKFYFFDQEWMAKYLPVEFILYRAIINSYDLVRNVNIDNLLEKIELNEYRELFNQIDTYLRKKIVDEEKLQKLNKNYRKMYEEIYDKKVLEIQNHELKVTIENQNQYIKELQEDV